MTFITSINWHSFLLILILHNLGKGGGARKEKRRRERKKEREKKGGVLRFVLSLDFPVINRQMCQ